MLGGEGRGEDLIKAADADALVPFPLDGEGEELCIDS